MHLGVLVLLRGLAYAGQAGADAAGHPFLQGQKAGAWFSYNDEKLGQGRDKSKEFLSENPELLKEIEQKVREKLANNNKVEVKEEA